MLCFIVSSLCDLFRHLQFRTLIPVTMNIQDTDQSHENFYVTKFAGITFLVPELLAKIH